MQQRNLKPSRTTSLDQTGAESQQFPIPSTLAARVGQSYGLGKTINPVIEPPMDSNIADVADQVRREKRKKWRIFATGLAVRLLGLLLIWLGDGSPSVFRKAVVVLGVILSIGGIAVLRYLLISGLRKKK